VSARAALPRAGRLYACVPCEHTCALVHHGCRSSVLGRVCVIVFSEDDDLRPYTDAFDVSYEGDPHCEDCGCSIIDRFGGLPTQVCESCSADWQRLEAAVKIYEE